MPEHPQSRSCRTDAKDPELDLRYLAEQHEVEREPEQFRNRVTQRREFTGRRQESLVGARGCGEQRRLVDQNYCCCRIVCLAQRSQRGDSALSASSIGCHALPCRFVSTNGLFSTNGPYLRGQGRTQPCCAR